jgi:hypothetical protein
MIIYQAFIESELDVSRHLARRVHELYFRNTRSSTDATYGACPMRSPRHSRTLTRFLSFGPQPSSAASSRPDSTRAFDFVYRVAPPHTGTGPRAAQWIEHISP